MFLVRVCSRQHKSLLVTFEMNMARQPTPSLLNDISVLNSSTWSLLVAFRGSLCVSSNLRREGQKPCYYWIKLCMCVCVWARCTTNLAGLVVVKENFNLEDLNPFQVSRQAQHNRWMFCTSVIQRQLCRDRYQSIYGSTVFNSNNEKPGCYITDSIKVHSLTSFYQTQLWPYVWDAQDMILCFKWLS